MVLYKAVLELGRVTKDGVKTPKLEDIIPIAHRWLDAKVEVNVDDLLTDNTTLRFGYNKDLRIEFDQLGDEQIFGFELRHPDEQNLLDEWRTAFAVRLLPNKATAQVTVEKIDTTTGNHYGRAYVGSPRIVRMLVDEVGAFEPNMDILTQPFKISVQEAELLTKFIKDPTRKLPVIYASATNKEGGILIDPEKTAEMMSGVAHVMYPATSMASWEIERFMKVRDQKCYDGAVRIYWPSVAGHMFNRFFTPDRLRASSTFRGYNFQGSVLGLVSEFHIRGPDAVTLADIKQLKNRKSQMHLQEVRDYRALAESYAADNSGLREALERANALTASLEQRCNLLQDALEERQEQALERTSDNVFINNVYDAVIEIQKMFPDRVSFLSRAVDQAKKSEYSDPRSVFNALRTVATTYYDGRTGALNLTDINRLFLATSGFKYSGGQSEQTMKEYSEEYFAMIGDGRKLPLEEHLKVGTGRDPRNNIRIAFHYDAQTKKVYVGFIGVHQTNTRS